FDSLIGILDTVSGIIGDTVEVPVLINRDMPLTPIDMQYSLMYNTRALQYLSISSKYTTPATTIRAGGLDIELPECDSVMKGEITKLKFILDVPDTALSSLVLIPRKF